MQYVITHPAFSKGRGAIIAQKNLVFIDLEAESVFRREGIVFTDGNAAVRRSNFFTSISDLEKLEWDTITCAGDYRSTAGKCYDKEWKRKRASEVLFPGRIPKKLFSRIVVFDQRARTRLIRRIRALEGSSGRTIRYPSIYCRSEVEEIYYYD